MPLSPWFALVWSEEETTIWCLKCELDVAHCTGERVERTTKVRTACGEHDKQFHPNDPWE